MPEQLLQAVLELTKTTQTLERTLHEYPKRREVEERFATKAESRKRAVKVLVAGLCIVFISLMASYFVTVTTVTSCFLSDGARNGDAAPACSLLPGYTEAQQENEERVDRIERLFNNSARLDRIEKELGLPPNIPK